MMKKWNMIIDVAKCHDCNNCFLACKDEFYGNSFPPYSDEQPRHGHRWMDILRKERGRYPKVDVAYLPKPCMHCDDAPCMNVSKNGAVYKREDGIVIIDPEKARGARELIDACPYGAIYWNEEKNLPQKCTFCAHLLDEGWKVPRCVQACPTGALRVVLEEDAEIKKMIASDGLQEYRPEYKTSPRVYYKDLYRFNRCFVAGSVALRDTDECAEGAAVNLYDGSKEAVARTETNNFGDFKIDNLKGGKAEYTIKVVLEGYKNSSLGFELDDSLNLGTIFLSKLNS